MWKVTFALLPQVRALELLEKSGHGRVLGLFVRGLMVSQSAFEQLERKHEGKEGEPGGELHNLIRESEGRRRFRGCKVCCLFAHCTEAARVVVLIA